MTGTQLPNIAFIGKAGAGKTTCAQVLIDQFGYERLSFAEPLKVGCATRDNRGLLQKVGQGVRDLYPDFWVNLALASKRREEEEEEAAGSYSNFGPESFKWVNDDCRYWNEATALKAEGFVIVRITAPTNRRVQRLQDNGRLQSIDQLDHVSETDLDDFQHDHRIVNDGWPDSLAGALERILNLERR